MKTILCTGNGLSERHIRKLENLDCQVVIAPADLCEDELIDAGKNSTAHILIGTEKFSRRVLEAASTLRIITFFGVGYASYIDTAAATACGIAVTNAPGANAQSVAEFTMALMLDAVKQTPQLARTTKQGQWTKEKSWELSGKTLGIIGMGAVASKVATIARHGFGMNILYCGTQRKPAVEKTTGARFVPLSVLLQTADIVSLHAAENNQTKGMIGAAELQLMKPSAVLINTARAGLVDAEALHDALLKQTIARAAFDVYYEEPCGHPQNDKYKLLDLPDELFLLTPHAGYFTADATNNSADMNVDSIIAALNDQPIPNLINPEFAKQAKRQ